MKKFAAACCYYGKLPEYFPLWLRSAGKNPSIDFFLFSDRETVKEAKDVPENVHIVILPFGELKERIQRKYPFRITLTSPYKLCDYKFAYGEIFEDYFAPYDYFGWYDIDLIWGNLAEFITEEARSCDFIGDLGHFTLMRNTRALRRLYKKSRLPTSSAVSYKRVFTTEQSCFFDELYGSMRIRLDDAIKTAALPMADVVPWRRGFTLFHDESEREYVFFYENGEIFSSERDKKFAYVHMQKRNMRVEEGVYGSECFYIKPNAFSLSAEADPSATDVDYEGIKERIERQYRRAELFYRKARGKIIVLKFVGRLKKIYGGIRRTFKSR